MALVNAPFWTYGPWTHPSCVAAGDMAAISQLHAFLEHWGLINFQAEQDAAGGLLRTPQMQQLGLSGLSELYRREP